LSDPRAAIEAALGERPASVAPLGGGCVAEVYRIELAGGERLVAKVDDSASTRLDVEGYMLEYLAAHSPLPVPRVRHCAPELLVMTWLPGTAGCDSDAEAEAAALLAELHRVSADRYGLERDTAIGGLPQPNPWAESWVRFFAEQRLVHMAQLAADAGRLPPDVLERVHDVAARLDDWLDEPERPSLLHGDVWSGNILTDGGRVTGFVDPAIYYGHPEVELAFIGLFHTFGDRFFDAYAERRPIEDGFFELRQHVYNLYPLLVHVRLFGGGYLGDLVETLGRVVG
jgi:fructosamine-3-kinase